MKQLKYFIVYLTLSLFLFPLFPKNVYSYTIYTKPQVLILNSYHNGHEWTDSIVNEITNVFKSKLPGSYISIEYMDTKRISNPEYFEELYKLYKYKYYNQKIDLIISSDNRAFDFLLEYRDELFPNTPVVFCGVNNFNENRLIGHELFTGIAENADIKANLDIALKLHPKTKNIAVITNNTSTNAALRNNLTLAILSKKNKVNLDYIEDTNIEVVQKKISELPSDSIIFLLTPVLKNPDGGLISETDASRLISSTSKIPVYSFWGYYMNNGIVGGMLTSGSNQGRQAAEMGIKLLKGTLISNIPIINNNNSNNLVFDYKQLQYYRINDKLLPKGSTIINAPPKSYIINKQILWFSVFAVILLLMITVIILSITIRKLKNADKALMESEERYRKLVDFLPDAIYVTHNGIMAFSNAAGLKLLGLDNIDELMGQEVMKYISPDPNSLQGWKMSHLLLNNSAMPLHEYKIIKKDGSEIYSESSSIAFPWEGDRALLIVARDITERKQAEEFKRKLEENDNLLRETRELDVLKTEFFANISHELKTPLNVVLSSAQMLEAMNCGNIKFDNSTKMSKYICMMKQNCFRLIRLVDNLIDSTKIDSGYFQLNLKNLDIVSIVEDTTLSVVKYIEDKGINLIFDTEMEEKIIACDCEKIERIILNLLSNAAKFTNEGGRIMVSIKDSISSIIISVKDTGIGIPKDKQDAIFERFVMVDKSLERNHLGSGLGLSIVKSLVELHGGKISLESEPGCGSEFIIELPANLVPETDDSNENNSHPVKVNNNRINIEFSDIV